jgi:predicted Zn finger-like uncharacterized protein
MILTCPNCATSYEISEAQLGPQGRTVRCAACKTTWHAQKSEDPIDLPLSKIADKPPSTLKEVKAKKLPLMYREMIEGQKRHQALMKQGLIWGALALSFASVLGLAFLLRVDVVRAFPRLAGAYASVGVPVNPTGLEFISYKAEPNLRGGRFVVTVSAEIRNLRDADTPVPPVRAKVVNAENETISETLIPPNGLVVDPLATRTLVFDVPDSQNMASSLKLAFDLEAMKDLSKVRPSALKANAYGPITGSETDTEHGSDQGEPAHKSLTEDHETSPTEAAVTDQYQSKPADALKVPPMKPAHGVSSDAHNSGH